MKATLDWTGLLTGTIGVVAALAYALLWREGNDPVLRSWLRSRLSRAPWEDRRALPIGLQAALLSPRRENWDSSAVACASAGAASARGAMAIAATGRIALLGILLVAVLFTRSAGLWLLGIAAALAAVATTRVARSARTRALARLAGLWALTGLIPAGLAHLGEIGKLGLAPWSPAVDALIFAGLGTALGVAGWRLPCLLLPAAGLAGAGWLGTQAVLGLLGGSHLGVAIRQVRLGLAERDDARLAAHGTAVTQAAQGLLVLLGTLVTLPAVAQSTGAPIAVTLVLLLWEFCAWALVTATWYAARVSFDETLRVRSAEGDGTEVPSIGLAPLIVQGVVWRAKRLEEIAERFDRPRSEVLTPFKIGRWRRDAQRLGDDIESLRRRASNAALHVEEADDLAGALRSAAQTQVRIEHWLERNGRRAGSHGDTQPTGHVPTPSPSAWRAG